MSLRRRLGWNSVLPALVLLALVFAASASSPRATQAAAPSIHITASVNGPQVDVRGYDDTKGTFAKAAHGDAQFEATKGGFTIKGLQWNWVKEKETVGSDGVHAVVVVSAKLYQFFDAPDWTAYVQVGDQKLSAPIHIPQVAPSIDVQVGDSEVFVTANQGTTTFFARQGEGDGQFVPMQGGVLVPFKWQWTGPEGTVTARIASTKLSTLRQVAGVTLWKARVFLKNGPTLEQQFQITLAPTPTPSPTPTPVGLPRTGAGPEPPH